MLKTILLSVHLASGLSSTLAGVSSAVDYAYDPNGRVTSALYDNGLCVLYTYDANGNRTAQTNTVASTPETATWGTGSLGCFKWTPP